MPRHVAIIMDGNGRWAAARGLPRGEGHRRGVEALRKTVRAAGELRLSNFLLWQAAYSELVFVPTYWPDFDRAALEDAIAEYHRRERRFGGLIAQTGS